MCYSEYINRIEQAVKEATGYDFPAIKEEGRGVTELFFARVLFDHELVLLGLNPSQRARVFNRTYASVSRYAEIYDNEYQTNRSFRIMADRVKDLINNIK